MYNEIWQRYIQIALFVTELTEKVDTGSLKDGNNLLSLKPETNKRLTNDYIKINQHPAFSQ